MEQLEHHRQWGLIATFGSKVHTEIKDNSDGRRSLLYKDERHLARSAARPVAGAGIDTTDSEGAGGEAAAGVGVVGGPEAAGGGELGEGAEASPLTSPGRFAAAA